MSTVQYQESEERGNQDTCTFISNTPLRLAISFFLLAFFFRVVDIFVLEMNATDFGILPSKIIPIVLIFLYFKKTGRKVEEVGIHSREWKTNLALALLAILAFNGILVVGDFLVLHVLNLHPQLSFYKLDYIFFDLTYQTANAIMEEMLFRGLMLLCFMAMMRPLRANILQAFLFGLWHVVWPINSFLGGLISLESAIGWAIEYTLSSMMIGLLWGYMMQRTGSLLSPIILHFSINFISAYVFVEPSISLLKLILGLVGFILTFITVKIFTRKKPDQNEGRMTNTSIVTPSIS